jgi:hypothetical protein
MAAHKLRLRQLQAVRCSQSNSSITSVIPGSGFVDWALVGSALWMSSSDMGINFLKKSARATVYACTSAFLVIPTEQPSCRNVAPRLGGMISISRTWFSLVEKMRASSWNASSGLDIDYWFLMQIFRNFYSQALIISEAFVFFRSGL